MAADGTGTLPGAASTTAEAAGSAPDPREPIKLLFRDLRTSPTGLSEREAARRQTVYGPNTLSRRAGRHRLRELAQQFTHPLALLLAFAAVLAAATGSLSLAVAILAVILLNALLAFAQEQQAERAVEALSAFLPEQATVMRDGVAQTRAATALVPGRRADRRRGRPRLGRRPTGRRRCRGRPVRTDRGVRAGVPFSGFRRPGGSAAGRPRPAVLGYGVHRRPRLGGGHRHRDAHGTGPDRGAQPAYPPRGEPAGAPGQAGRPAHRAGRDRRRTGLPAAGHSPPASPSERPRPSPSVCSSPTSPRACCRRSPSPWPPAYANWPGGGRWSNASPPWRRSARPRSSAPTRPAR